MANEKASSIAGIERKNTLKEISLDMQLETHASFNLESLDSTLKDTHLLSKRKTSFLNSKLRVNPIRALRERFDSGVYGTDVYRIDQNTTLPKNKNAIGLDNSKYRTHPVMNQHDTRSIKVEYVNHSSYVSLYSSKQDIERSDTYNTQPDNYNENKNENKNKNENENENSNGNEPLYVYDENETSASVPINTFTSANQLSRDSSYANINEDNIAGFSPRRRADRTSFDSNNISIDYSYMSFDDFNDTRYNSYMGSTNSLFKFDNCSYNSNLDRMAECNNPDIFSRRSIFKRKKPRDNNISGYFKNVAEICAILSSGGSGAKRIRKAILRSSTMNQVLFAKNMISVLEEIHTIDAEAEESDGKQEIEYEYCCYAYQLYKSNMKMLGSSSPTYTLSNKSTLISDESVTTISSSKAVLTNELNFLVRHLYKKGVPEAAYMLACWYSEGKFGNKKDKEKATALFTIASKSHHPEASHKIATYNEAKRHFLSAVAHYTVAASQNEIKSLYRLAVAYLSGELDVKKNIKLALNYLKRAANGANKECPDGAYLLGIIYLGEYPDKQIYNSIIVNYDEGLNLLEAASELNMSKAQHRLGQIYEFGEHQQAFDPLNSVIYYSMAVENDFPEAQLALAEWHLTGHPEVIDQCDDLSFYYCKKAAENGCTRAYVLLGYFYEAGIGVEQHPEKALECYKIAKKGGFNISRMHADRFSAARHSKESQNRNLLSKRGAAKTLTRAASNGHKSKDRVSLCSLM